MTFNTAVSGLRAANSDLSVRGNNIANASTTGFKASRAEFGDVYASSLLGSGANTIGSGVLLSNVAQEFSQGNVSFTSNSLDLAINGAGFFIVNNNGAREYTRAGLFALDKEGFVVNNQGSVLQGQLANANGIISGATTDLQVSLTGLDPAPTLNVNLVVNVDAREIPPAVRTLNLVSANTAVIGVPQTNAGSAAANGYPGTGGTESITFTDQTDGSTVTIDEPSVTDASASSSAANINRLGISGIAASATTSILIDFAGAASAINTSGDFSINGNVIGGTTPATIMAFVNANLSSVGMSAELDGAGTGVIITQSSGADMVTNVTAGGGLSFLSIDGYISGSTTPAPVGAPVTIDDGTAFDDFATVGGFVTINVDERYDPNANTPTTVGTFWASPNISSVSVANTFDPATTSSYNHTTSVTVYDSLGNPHVMTAYLVKESPFNPAIGALNAWTMYTQIDDIDVGGATQPPTEQSFPVRFNSDGSLDTVNTLLPFNIPNWSPIDSTGAPNGATSPTSFDIDLTGTTQFGAAFAVNQVSQDGFAAGQLAGLDIGSSGLIFARFTNGQSRNFGQIQLANFVNQQGLSPVGNTSWVESFDSGPPTVNVAGQGGTGKVQAGALEESNTDLSEELVGLIIAQRNFQANAKTIEAESATTQTVINIR